MAIKTTQHARDWVRWLQIRGMPAEHIAGVLDLPLDRIVRLLAARLHKPDDEVWPFKPLSTYTPENVRKRKILNQTATYCRRLTTLGYAPPQIAELLLLDENRVRDFVRRALCPRGRRGEPICPSDMLDRRAARERAAERTRLRKEQHAANPGVRCGRWKSRCIVPPEWTFAASREISRSEVTALAQCQAAIKAGILSNGELFDLFSRAYYAPRIGPAPPPIEPAIWTGPESYHYGASKLDTEQVAEIRELRRAGWSTGRLARRFSCTRSTICNVLLHRTSYRPPCPAPPIILPSSDDKSRISARKQGLITPAPWRNEVLDSDSGDSHTCCAQQIVVLTDRETPAVDPLQPSLSTSARIHR